MSNSLSFCFTGVAEDPDQYKDVLHDHDVNEELLAHVLWQTDLAFDDKNAALFQALADTPEISREQVLRLHLYVDDVDREEESDYWHEPEVFAEAARALAHVFRQRLPLAKYLFDLTLAENRYVADRIDWFLQYSRFWPHAPGDWGENIAIHLGRLADAALTIGRMGDKRIRFEVDGMA